MKRIRACGIALGVATVAALVLGPAAGAAPLARQATTAADTAHGGGGGAYLALGDSVPFGYRPPQVTPPAQYFDADNFRGYPEDVAAARGLKLTNATCPGETTLSMYVPGAQSNGCENSLTSPGGYRSVYPLHVRYSGTQLNYAVSFLKAHRHTKLVTITIGANDLFLCEETTKDMCAGPELLTTAAKTGQHLAHILGVLRNTAHYHGKLVLLDYYSTDYTNATQTVGSATLDTALAVATTRYRGVVADGFGAFLAASALHGAKPCAAGLLIKLPDGTCNVHPTAKGHRVLASAVERVLH
ncbi:MAG: SGNH/GDSL hydrolase family protein [Sciscionella sp.]